MQIGTISADIDISTWVDQSKISQNMLENAKCHISYAASSKFVRYLWAVLCILSWRINALPWLREYKFDLRI